MTAHDHYAPEADDGAAAMITEEQVDDDVNAMLNELAEGENGNNEQF